MLECESRSRQGQPEVHILDRVSAALANGISQSNVLPFWRVISPGSTIAKRLNLDAETLLELLTSDVGH
jgi:hypothetical protein